jgi:hypothetical protein
VLSIPLSVPPSNSQPSSRPRPRGRAKVVPRWNESRGRTTRGVRGRVDDSRAGSRGARARYVRGARAGEGRRVASRRLSEKYLGSSRGKTERTSGQANRTASVGRFFRRAPPRPAGPRARENAES